MAGIRLPRGRMVIVWHPESPGSKLTVWRPWWKRKMRPFATLGEWDRATRPTLNAIVVKDVI